MAIELSALAYMMTASVARHSEMTANFETISFQLLLDDTFLPLVEGNENKSIFGCSPKGRMGS